MGRPLTVATAICGAVLLSVVLTATASSGPKAPACTLVAAKSGILASKLPMKVKRDAAGRNGSGIDRLICRDLTYDGRRDMIASVYSGPAIGVEAWVFFRALRTGWSLAFSRVGLTRAKVQVKLASVVEIDPVYRTGDKRPCCPTGGLKHYRFQWQRGKMAKIRVWHTGI